jgi:hypothetical protein
VGEGGAAALSLTRGKSPVSDSSKAGLPHLNRVRVVAGDCEITITWAERERLLQHVERDIADRFQAVGASRPVELNEEQGETARAARDGRTLRRAAPASYPSCGRLTAALPSQRLRWRPVAGALKARRQRALAVSPLAA